MVEANASSDMAADRSLAFFTAYFFITETLSPWPTAFRVLVRAFASLKRI